MPRFHFTPEFFFDHHLSLVSLQVYNNTVFVQIYTSGSEEVALANRLFGVGERLVSDRVEFVVRCDCSDVS